MFEVPLFPTQLFVFKHEDPIIDEEVDNIPDDPDILSHLSEGAKEEIVYGSHTGMEGKNGQFSNRTHSRRFFFIWCIL